MSIHNLSCVCLRRLSAAVGYSPNNPGQGAVPGRTDARVLTGGAMSASAAQGRRNGAPDPLQPDQPEDCRPQVSVMPLP